MAVDSLDVDALEGLCLIRSSHIKIYLPGCCICDGIIISLCLPFRGCNGSEIDAIVKRLPNLIHIRRDKHTQLCTHFK